jgi:hypothetical protein
MKNNKCDNNNITLRQLVGVLRLDLIRCRWRIRNSAGRCRWIWPGPSAGRPGDSGGRPGRPIGSAFGVASLWFGRSRTTKPKSNWEDSRQIHGRNGRGTHGLCGKGPPRSGRRDKTTGENPSRARAPTIILHTQTSTLTHSHTPQPHTHAETKRRAHARTQRHWRNFFFSFRPESFFFVFFFFPRWWNRTEFVN